MEVWARLTEERIGGIKTGDWKGGGAINGVGKGPGRKGGRF